MVPPFWITVVRFAVQAWSLGVRFAVQPRKTTFFEVTGIRPIIKRIDPYACKQAMSLCLLIALLIAYVNIAYVNSIAYLG